ncbi:MAG: hypothetical protein AAF989_10440 [Planctomycetota bacterium]
MFLPILSGQRISDIDSGFPSRRPLGRLGMTVLGLTCMLAASTGCRICCPGDTEAYGAYGGKWARTHRSQGRVGSVFDPGGALVSNLSAKDEPPSAADLERQRRSREEGEDGENDGLPDNGTEKNGGEGDSAPQEPPVDLDKLRIEDIEVSYETPPITLID